MDQTGSNPIRWQDASTLSDIDCSIYNSNFYVPNWCTSSVRFKQPFCLNLPTNPDHQPKVMTTVRTRVAPYIISNVNPVLISTVLNVTCTHFTSVVQTVLGGKIMDSESSVTIVQDYYAYDPLKVESNTSDFTQFGTLDMPNRYSSSNVPGKAVKVFDKPFTSPPAVFGQVRMNEAIDAEGINGEVGGFMVTIAEVTNEHVEFSFVCQTEPNNDNRKLLGPLEDWVYTCTWSNFYFLDWRAWPTNSEDYNTTNSLWGGNPYHNIYNIGSYSTSGLTGSQQETVSFSHYSNLNFTAPPGMIASLAVNNPHENTGLNNVYALGLGIDTVDTQASFFADIYHAAGQSWTNENELQLFFFTWNGTGVYCNSTNGLLCNGHGVCPDGGSDSDPMSCLCETNWNGNVACTTCASNFATSSCTPCDGYDDKIGACSGHGVCDDGIEGTGTCECDEVDGYTGEGCGTCNSADGWFGNPSPPYYQDCARCPYSGGVDGKVCNGKGLCVEIREDGDDIWECQCSGNFSNYDNGIGITTSNCTECKLGYAGEECELECPLLCSGRGECGAFKLEDNSTLLQCSCLNSLNGYKHGYNYSTYCEKCLEGYEGPYCCKVGFTGENCDNCNEGFAGAGCNECASGYYGNGGDGSFDNPLRCTLCPWSLGDDAQECNGAGAGECAQDEESGDWACNCLGNYSNFDPEHGITTTNCTTCTPGFGGDQCELECEGKCYGRGTCIDGGAVLPFCDCDNDDGVHGYDYEAACEKCMPGYSGDYCCVTGYEGASCTECSSNYIINTQTDNRGSCVACEPHSAPNAEKSTCVCVAGYQTDKDANDNDQTPVCNVTVSAIVYISALAGGLFLLGSTCGCWYYRKNRLRKTLELHKLDMLSERLLAQNPQLQGMEQAFRTMASDAADWLIDFDDIELGTVVGSGTSAHVFRGWYSDQAVAVKRLHSVRWDAKEFEAFFTQEAGLIARLHHPNVVRFYGVCYQDDHFYIVTEYCHENLSQALRRLKEELKGPLPFDLALNLAYQIAKGMQYLHSKSVIHRDLKPENILIDDTGSVKLCDFGLSRLTTNDVEMTQQVGTPAYMAPEMAGVGEDDEDEDEEVDEETGRGINRIGKPVDVYSYGILLWTLWTQKLPYSDLRVKNPFQLMVKVTSGFRPSVPNEMPKVLADLMQKCWAGNPKKRPTFDEIIAEIRTEMKKGNILYKSSGGSISGSWREGNSTDPKAYLASPKTKPGNGVEQGTSPPTILLHPAKGLPPSGRKKNTAGKQKGGELDNVLNQQREDDSIVSGRNDDSRDNVSISSQVFRSM